MAVEIVTDRGDKLFVLGKIVDIKPIAELTCPNCGKVFVKMHGKQKYCCYECGVKYGYALWAERQKGAKK